MKITSILLALVLLALPAQAIEFRTGESKTKVIRSTFISDTRAGAELGAVELGLAVSKTAAHIELKTEKLTSESGEIFWLARFMMYATEKDMAPERPQPKVRID